MNVLHHSQNDASGPPFASLDTRPISSAAEWAELLEASPLAHSVQAFSYGEAKAVLGWRPTRLAYQLDGRDVAIVQALHKRVGGVTVATRVNRGPVFLDADPPFELLVSVHKSLRRRWGRIFSGGPLLLAPALTKAPRHRMALALAGFSSMRRAGWSSARLDLARPEQQLFEALKPNWRKSIRAAQKAGVTVRIDEGEAARDWMIEHHLLNMRQKGFRGHGARFLRALRTCAGADYVLFRAFHDEEPVAGLVVLRFGSAADQIVAWFGPQGRQVKAGNMITWQAILEMRRRGCLSFDVGGINSDAGFSDFKSGLQGTEYHLLDEVFSL